LFVKWFGFGIVELILVYLSQTVHKSNQSTKTKTKTKHILFFLYQKMKDCAWMCFW
jgi:hypothetical protein